MELIKNKSQKINSIIQIAGIIGVGLSLVIFIYFVYDTLRPCPETQVFLDPCGWMGKLLFLAYGIQILIASLLSYVAARYIKNKLYLSLAFFAIWVIFILYYFVGR